MIFDSMIWFMEYFSLIHVCQIKYSYIGCQLWLVKQCKCKKIVIAWTTEATSHAATLNWQVDEFLAVTKNVLVGLWTGVPPNFFLLKLKYSIVVRSVSNILQQIHSKNSKIRKISYLPKNTYLITPPQIWSPLQHYHHRKRIIPTFTQNKLFACI